VGVASFFTHHREATFASTALADPISKQFVACIHRFAADSEIPVVRFEKRQRKDDVAHRHLAEFGDGEGIYLVGVAQEKINTFGTEKRRNPETGARYPWIVAATALVNQYYPVWPGRRLWPVLYQVLQLLPVRGAAVLQRPSLGPTPGPRMSGSSWNFDRRSTGLFVRSVTYTVAGKATSCSTGVA
jgi:hypothetical protein